MRFLTVIAALLIVVAAWGQKAPSLVGSWVFDPATVDATMKARKLVLTFKPGGHYTLKGIKLDAAGTYTFAKGKLFMIPATANGKRVPKGAGEAVGRLGENGKALFIDSGRLEKGKPKMFRLVRKK